MLVILAYLLTIIIIIIIMRLPLLLLLLLAIVLQLLGSLSARIDYQRHHLRYNIEQHTCSDMPQHQHNRNECPNKLIIHIALC